MTIVIPESIDEVEDRTGCLREVCEKVLNEENGDINNAICLLLAHTTKYTYVRIKIGDGHATMVKFKSQAELAFRKVDFLEFSRIVMNAAHKKKATRLSHIEWEFEEDRQQLVRDIRINVDIADVGTLKGRELFSYTQGWGRYAAIVSTSGATQVFGVELAWHIACSECEYIEPKDIPDDVLEDERERHLEFLLDRGQSEEEAAPRLASHMREWTKKLALVLQTPLQGRDDETMGDRLAANNVVVLDFIRFDDRGPFSPYNFVQELSLD